MSDLYPFLMQPIFDPRPWGTQDLSPIYPNHRFEEKIGESWLTGDASKVNNGPLQGKTLSELSAQYQREFVGDAQRSVIVLSVDQAIDTDAGEEVVSARALSKPEILNPFVADLGQAPKTAT